MARVDREWLRELVRAADKSARALSLEAGLGATAVKDILSGKSRDPGAATLSAIADKLGVLVEDLLEHGESSSASRSARDVQIVPRYLIARYRVQAGNWYEVDTEEPPRPYTGAVAPNPRYAEWPQWLEEVIGDSVDLKIQPGKYAHVVDAIEMGYAPTAGDWVVVERRTDQGAKRERTIKQIEINGDAVELWPRSSNPKWSKPVCVTDGARSVEDTEVEIVGLVIGAYDGDF